jgi:glycosyltransferase involved in cell wall biosynthesis
VSPPNGPFLFVFRERWPERVREVAVGRAPAEAYGFFELQRRGLDVEAVDSSLVRRRGLRVGSLLWQRLYAIPRSGLGYRLDQAHAVRDYMRGDPGRYILATTDSLALPLLALRARRRLPNRIAYFSIGLCDAIQRGAVAPELRRRYLRLTERADVVFVFTPVELELFAEFAPGSNVRVLPLGIDVEWWSPPPTMLPDPQRIVAPGRDPSRSFPILAAAVRGLPARTTVVGSLARAQGIQDQDGLQVIDDVPFAELRSLFWTASVVAISSRRSAYGSGQSTALQAMASARTVVMTDSSWARQAGLRAGVHFLGVPPEDSDALREALEAGLECPRRTAAMGRRAQSLVTARFSLAAQADALLDALGGSV